MMEQYMTNMYATNRALEKALEKNASHPAVELIHFPKELSRTESLKADIAFLSKGPAGPCRCASVQAIVQRIEWISENEPHLLVAYSYVRYLGDMSGGQFLSKKIQKTYGLAEKGYDFYLFDSVPEMDHFKNLYRARLDQIPKELQMSIAKEAFRLFKGHEEFFAEVFVSCPMMCGLPSASAKVHHQVQVQQCAVVAPWVKDECKRHGIGHAQIVLGVLAMGLALYAV
jgi:heme oxygenase